MFVLRGFLFIVIAAVTMIPAAILAVVVVAVYAVAYALSLAGFSSAGRFVAWIESTSERLSA